MFVAFGLFSCKSQNMLCWVSVDQLRPLKTGFKGRYVIEPVFIIISIIFVKGQNAFAGAWNQPVGESLVVSSLNWSMADQGYDDDGRLTYDPEFSKTESRLYIEHGLTQRLTLIGNGGLQTLDYLSQKGPVNADGFGGLSLGLQYHIAKRAGDVFALRGSAIIAGSGENIPDADLGSGGHGVELRMLYGRGFSVREQAAFVNIEGAWIYREISDSPNGYEAEATLGIDIGQRAQLLGQLFFRDTHADYQIPDPILANYNFKAQLSSLWKRGPGKAYQISIYQSLGGRNSVKEQGVTISFLQRFALSK